MKVEIKKGPNDNSAAVIGFCEKCKKDCRIEFPSVQAAVLIVQALGLKQCDRKFVGKSIVYTYS